MGVIDALLREAMLFAAIGFLIGGIEELGLDLIYLRHRMPGRRALPLLDDLPPPSAPGHIVVLVPAWDEAGVIGAMLRATLARYDHADWRLYVGTYPNDPATIRAVAEVAAEDARIRLVIGTRAGPTTKADCLNTLWRALVADEAAERFRAKAVVIHDAEDLVHPAELRVFDTLIERHPAVQLPVLPLVDRRARLVSGHYADDFAQAHGKTLVVRQALGAGMPLAGTGCCIARDTLDRLAGWRGGDPFDAASLTEDYELGIGISGLVQGGVLARLRESPGGPLVAVRAYFPATVDAAIRQKSRWLIGIALEGWDRLGWSRPAHLVDHWMRLRDRRAPLAMLVLASAYLALLAWGASLLLHHAAGTTLPAIAPGLLLVLHVNAALLAWRLAVRAGFVWRAYGPGEAMWSLPRAIVGNFIDLLAARRAIWRYLRMLGGERLRWDKTAHVFPSQATR